MALEDGALHQGRLLVRETAGIFETVSVVLPRACLGKSRSQIFHAMSWKNSAPKAVFSRRRDLGIEGIPALRAVWTEIGKAILLSG